jgi:hypothetical protein
MTQWLFYSTSSSASTMGIFFSSTTVDLQNKDFLTPGVIDFRPYGIMLTQLHIRMVLNLNMFHFISGG